MDFDPDGIAIMSNYKYGSVALAHENAHLNVSGIRWLGVRSAVLYAEEEPSDDENGLLLRLTARDRRKAVKMLEKEVFADEGPETEWRRELQVMLMLDVKAEIQLLSGREGGLEAWLEGKLLDGSSL